MNKVILIGNCGRDPQVRELQDGTKVATLTLATTERGYTLQNGTQVPERTEWHNLVFWRRAAETVENYVRKGDKLCVEGKIQSRKYTGQDNVERTAYEIVVDKMEMLSSKPKRDDAPAPQAAPAGQDYQGGAGFQQAQAMFGKLDAAAKADEEKLPF